METIRKLVKPGAILQGGAFRLDKGPTGAEHYAFRYVVLLHNSCVKNGLETKLACIVNDLGVKPEERPKATGKFSLPSEYIQILSEMQIPPESVLIFYESTLRNRARGDMETDGSIAHKIDEFTGKKVPVCASIMGRFYADLTRAGYTQQVGFYARNPVLEIPEEKPDTSCPFGPLKGAVKTYSGYSLGIEVLNYFVHPDGSITVGGIFEPQK